MELAQKDAARVSCRVARAVESGLRGRCSRVCARAVAHRAGGQQWAADAAGQDAILAGAAAKAACILRCDHSNVATGFVPVKFTICMFTVKTCKIYMFLL